MTEVHSPRGQDAVLWRDSELPIPIATALIGTFTLQYVELTQGNWRSATSSWRCCRSGTLPEDARRSTT